MESELSGVAMKKHVKSPSATLRGRKTGMRRRTTITFVSLVGSIALSLTLLGTFAALAAGVKETPTQANPWGLAFDNAGHVWVAEPGCDAEPNCLTTFQSYIGEYNRSDESLVKNYFEPSGYSSPVFLTLRNGSVWFTESTSNAIGRLIPGSTAHWSQWKVPTANANPYDLLFDKNGNLWFTEYTGNKIGFFNPSTKTFAETTVPTANSHPYGITMDKSGTIWFVENNAMQIASFTPTTSGKVTIKEHAMSARVGYYNPATGTYKTLTLSNANAHPYNGLGVDTTNNTWFTELYGGPTGSLGEVPAGTI
jgi:hypothetical protein